MVGGIPNISIPTIGYTMTQSSKMSLPVDPSSLLYSHFEHVSGIPAPKGTQGVSISKLNLLDVLIEQMNKIKSGSTVVSSASAIPEDRLDALIEGYENQIRQAKVASADMPYKPSPSAPSGVLFSLIS